MRIAIQYAQILEITPPNDGSLTELDIATMVAERTKRAMKDVSPNDPLKNFPGAGVSSIAIESLVGVAAIVDKNADYLGRVLRGEERLLIVDEPFESPMKDGVWTGPVSRDEE